MIQNKKLKKYLERLIIEKVINYYILSEMPLYQWNKLQSLVAKEVSKAKRIAVSDLFLDTDYPAIFAKNVDRNSDIDINTKNIRLIASKLMKLI